MSSPRFISFIVIIAGMVACGGAKKATTTTPQPQWVQGRPVSSSYYIGIGSARKGPDVNQYQQAAKQNAQADMASDISVNISSNSVLHAFEYNLNIREDFTSTIKAQTQQQLEGFELVDTWEDATNYWIYYRLSKAEYQKQKDIKRNNAAAIAADLLGKGLDSRSEGNTRMAIVQLIKALEPIKPYFSEPLTVDFRGNQIYLGNEIFQQLSTTIASVDLVARTPSIRVKVGQSIPADLLEFEAQSRFSPVVSDLPIVATYSEKPIRNNRKNTNSSGLVAFNIDNVQSAKSFETFIVGLDMEAILMEATTDLLIRRLVTNFKASSTETRINIEKPTLAIDSHEQNLGSPLSHGPIGEAIRNKAIESGLSVVATDKPSDFTIQIRSNTKAAGERGTYKVTALEGSITIENEQGVQLYQRNLQGFTGTHFEHKTAGEEAYKEARRKVETTFFREMLDAINRK